MAPKRSAVKENRYAPYEAKLDARGVTYTYVASVPLADITRYPDAQSRMRLSGKDKIKEYAEKMKQGEVYPPLVIGEDGTVDYMLLDGNTRKGALESIGRTHTDAYVVSNLSDHNEAIYLSALFNGINGVPLTNEEILRAIQSAGKTPNPPTAKTLAQDLGVSPSKITRLTTIDAFDTRAKALGVATDLTDDVKMALSSVGDNSVLGDLIALTLDAELKGKDIRAIVKDIAAKGSEAERRSVVADERTDRQTAITLIATGRTSTAPPAKDSLMAFGRIHTLMGKFPNVDQWVPVRLESRQDWHPKIGEIRTFLGDLEAAYEAAGI